MLGIISVWHHVVASSVWNCMDCLPCLSIIWSGLLTHWGRMTHICVSKLIIIGSDNGLSPGRCQAIIWTNAGVLLIGPSGTNFSEILIEIQTFSLKKIRLKMSSAKCCLFRLGLNVLTFPGFVMYFSYWAANSFPCADNCSGLFPTPVSSGKLLANWKSNSGVWSWFAPNLRLLRYVQYARLTNLWYSGLQWPNQG